MAFFYRYGQNLLGPSCSLPFQARATRLTISSTLMTKSYAVPSSSLPLRSKAMWPMSSTSMVESGHPSRLPLHAKATWPIISCTLSPKTTWPTISSTSIVISCVAHHLIYQKMIRWRCIDARFNEVSPKDSFKPFT